MYVLQFYVAKQHLYCILLLSFWLHVLKHSTHIFKMTLWQNSITFSLSLHLRVTKAERFPNVDLACVFMASALPKEIHFGKSNMQFYA